MSITASVPGAQAELLTRAGLPSLAELHALEEVEVAAVDERKIYRRGA